MQGSGSRPNMTMESSRTKKVTIHAPEPKPETERGKKIYRAILDMIRRHDDILKQKKGFRDVFLPEAIMLRDRLQEYCEKLMFFLPAEYGRKAEELMWRKVYYDIIQLMKVNRKHMTTNSSLLNAFYTHLAAATGYYHHLLHRLQSELDLNLEGIVDFYYVSEPKAHRKPHYGVKADPEPKVQEWAREACHRCLVYLGDIARYRLDYQEGSSSILSQRYYYQALALYPELGMPYNQLGTLAGSTCYNLDAAYYYIRCLICPHKFDGARGNLMRLFERNRRRFQELSHQQHLSDNITWEQQRSRDVKRFVVKFLHLLDIFFSKSNSVDSQGIQELCQTTLYDFNLCMFSQSTNGSVSVSNGNDITTDDKAHQLEDDAVFKIIIICLAMISLMQCEGNKQVAAVIAFSLALFSHILNHTIMRLQAAVYELENPRKPFDSKSPADAGDVADMEDSQETSHAAVKKHNSLKGQRQRVVRKESQKDSKNDEENETAMKSFKKTSKQRRMRRRRGSGSSGESSEEPARNDSDLSEGELSESGSGMESANHAADSSDSDQTDEDELAISQELKRGFGLTTDIDENSKTSDKQQPEGMNGKKTDGIMTGEKNLSSGPAALTIQSNSSTPRPVDGVNMADNLRDIPLDWLSDAANLLSNTLQFSYGPADMNVFRTEDGMKPDDNRPVRVPPGFEASTESHHVMEISEKLANFDIDTDTDISMYPTDNETSTVTESEIETETETDKESVIDRTEQEEYKLKRLLSVASEEGLLSTIKVYCDWMMVNPHIIVTCAKISSSLWFRLSVLLNFLPGEGDLIKKDICGSESLSQLISSFSSGNQQLQISCEQPPLPEDIHLRLFPPVNPAHQLLDFNQASTAHLNQQQQAILRIWCLRRFGYFVTKLNSVELTYEPNNRMFYGPQQEPTANVADDKLKEQKMVESEAKRNQLMKDMAQLRLQAEVNQLEGSLRRQQSPAGGPDGTRGSSPPVNLPPYLVVDAWSLCGHLPLIKQLAISSRFIVIVPLTVVDHLDVLKKDNPGAREAIRWLENEFRKGNRYIRAQKPHERAPVPQHLVRMSKRDKEAIRFLQMLECCKYLVQQSSSLPSMVCLLSNIQLNSSMVSLRTKENIAYALREGLMIESAPEFHKRWRAALGDGKG